VQGAGARRAKSLMRGLRNWIWRGSGWWGRPNMTNEAGMSFRINRKIAGASLFPFQKKWKLQKRKWKLEKRKSKITNQRSRRPADCRKTDSGYDASRWQFTAYTLFPRTMPRCAGTFPAPLLPRLVRCPSYDKPAGRDYDCGARRPRERRPGRRRGPAPPLLRRSLLSDSLDLDCLSAVRAWENIFEWTCGRVP
jgi:hypothetical protein